MFGRVCDGAGVGAAARVVGVSGFGGETAGKSTRCAVDLSASSPTRLLFVSGFAGDNLMLRGDGLVPNDGE